MGKLLLLIFVVGFGLFLSNDQWRSTMAGYFDKLITADNSSSKPAQTIAAQNYTSSNTDHKQRSSSNSYGSKRSVRGVFAAQRTNMAAELRKDSAGYKLTQERSKNTQAIKNSGANLSLQQNRQQNQSILKQGSSVLAQERSKTQSNLLNNSRTRGAFATNRTNTAAELRQDSASYKLTQERSKNTQAIKNSGANLSLQKNRQQNQSALKQGSSVLAQERLKAQSNLSSY